MLIPKGQEAHQNLSHNVLSCGLEVHMAALGTLGDVSGYYRTAYILI